MRPGNNCPEIAVRPGKNCPVHARSSWNSKILFCLAGCFFVPRLQQRRWSVTIWVGALGGMFSLCELMPQALVILLFRRRMSLSDHMGDDFYAVFCLGFWYFWLDHGEYFRYWEMFFEVMRLWTESKRWYWSGGVFLWTGVSVAGVTVRVDNVSARGGYIRRSWFRGLFLI